jgi:hypothetical protein
MATLPLSPDKAALINFFCEMSAQDTSLDAQDWHAHW